MKRRLININAYLLIGMIIFIAVVTVALIAWQGLSELNKPNGFARAFKGITYSYIDVTDKPQDITRIAGMTAQHIYFQTKNAAVLYQTDKDLQKGRYIQLGVPDSPETNSLFYTVVDSPNVTIMAGNVPAIIRTNLLNEEVLTDIIGSVKFSRAAKITETTFALRGTDTSIKVPDQVFIKSSLSPVQIRYENHISERRHDGGISTDGMLHYDKTTHSLIYVSYYSSNILVMDTNLILATRSQTIDTISDNQIGTSGNYTGHFVLLTNNTPKREVNAESCVADGLLYVHSALKADNESKDDFQQSSVIDVYDIRLMKYLFSFYLPKDGNGSIYDFKVSEDKVIVLYKHKVVSYQLQKTME